MESQVSRVRELIFKRRSIRVFRPGTVDEATIKVLLEAAMAAPSAVAMDPWRFIVVREEARKRELAAALPNGKMLPTAAIGIVVCGDIEVAHDRQLSYLLQDCSAAMENILLAVSGLGLGACWLGVHPRGERIKHVSTVLGLPAQVIPVAIAAIGHPGEQREPRTRYNPAFVHSEKW